MENETILAKLAQQDNESDAAETEDLPTFKFLVFSVADGLFALGADDVREISSSNEIYYVPFVPPYIRGYANRHGQPYTVFDLNMLFENTPLESETLLILKSETDQVAVLISDVKEIVAVAEREIFRITSDDESSRYYNGALNLEDTEVFVLKVDTLIERLERDLERS
ncbi:MAG: chemotaxis protein CheW [Spirochaeta sp.]|jgi:chemotaxis signal transduction protein|nr:chemotaxis protein CheW [Spirochaeta sp.]